MNNEKIKSFWIGVTAGVGLGIIGLWTVTALWLTIAELARG